MRYFRLLTVFLLTSLIMPFTHAAKVEGLYDAEAQVEDQSPGQRLSGFADAAKEVLVRVSGSRGIVNDPRVEKLLAAPSRYVQRYRYEASTSGEGYTLVCQFSERAIQQFLVENKMPVWSDQRPEVLVWIAVQERNRRYVLNEQSDVLALRVFESEAKRRGLPLTWPIKADISASSVTVSDIKAGFYERVSKASEPYKAQAILVGSVQELSGGRWQASWHFVNGGRATEWKSELVELPAAIASGIDYAADVLAAEFSVSAVESLDSGEVWVRVEHVSDLQSHARARAYLSELLLVEKLSILSVNEDYVDFKLKLRSSQEELVKRLALDKQLRIIERDVEETSVSLIAPEQVVEPQVKEPDFYLEWAK